MKIQRKFNWHRVTLVASCTAIVYAIAVALGAQTPTFSITLTGQSMIRSDARVHTPDIVARTAPLLKGDVIFTNFEATIIEKRPIDARWPVSLAARSAGCFESPGF